MHLMKLCFRYYNDILHVSLCVLCVVDVTTHTRALTHTSTLYHLTHAYTYIHTNTCTQPRTPSDLDLRLGMIHAHARIDSLVSAVTNKRNDSYSMWVRPIPNAREGVLLFILKWAVHSCLLVSLSILSPILSPGHTKFVQFSNFPRSRKSLGMKFK